MVVQADPLCADFPPGCQGMASDDLRDCLHAALCDPASMPEQASYEMGELGCGPAWEDCF